MILQIGSGALADAKGPSTNADLPVRIASAIVMIAVAGTALWMGGWAWKAFVFAVALVCYGEFARLLVKATQNIGVRIFGAVVGAGLLCLAALAMIAMPVAVLFGVLAVVIATDVGAYFAGRTIGGPKIAPKISPSKTWAGLIGGATLAGLVSAGSFVYQTGEFVLRPMLFIAFLIGALLACLAQSGDFFESWLKRKAGVKDSSNLIPGHGGVYDRIDGLLPVAISAAILWFQAHP